MSRFGGPLGVLGLALLVLGVAIRLHNAWAAPVLAGYDAFGHFTYLWFVAETGRVPIPTQGWSFFHPPLYYTLMASLWSGLDAFDPGTRLKAGKVVFAALGCVHAAVAWRIVKRRAPGYRAARWAAALLNLLVPVQVYTSGFLGNEALAAVLSSAAILVLLDVLDRPRAATSILLGVLLGLAMLTKTSTAAIVGGCAAAIATVALVKRSPRAGATTLALVLGVMLLVCGPWYLRNVALYGSPFQLSRTSAIVRYVEENQPQASRTWADYLTFDPVIFRRPVWPRGQSPLRDDGGRGFDRSVRESVWTGIYANTWFDAFGGWVLPPVVESEAARRAGQLLLLLGIVPTGLVIAGFARGLRRVWQRRWDQEQVAFLWVTAAMLVLLLMHTRNAPIAAAVKPSYLAPACVAFAFWLAEGLVALERRSRVWAARAVAICAVAGACSLAVFWQGFLFDAHAIRSSLPWLDDSRWNQLGVVEYAGGRPDAAKMLFEHAARSGYHLAWENLGFLDIEKGRREKGLKMLRRASRLQRGQEVAGSARSEEFHRLTAAEYEHSMAVVLHVLGRRERAVEFWHRALVHDPRHAEALWSLTLTQLEDALAAGPKDAERQTRLGDAGRALMNVRTLDPGLDEGWRLAVAVEAIAGDCDAARRTLDEWRSRPSWVQRNYPARTGTGSAFEASIGRRQLIAPSAADLTSGEALARCGLVAG